MSITLDNGNVVNPSDVIEEKFPAEGWLINFVPDESYIPSIVKNDKYKKYFEENNKPEFNIQAVYHSTQSMSIFKNEEYLSFMKKFGESVVHLIDWRDLNNEVVTRYKSVLLANRYKGMCPRLFPIKDFIAADVFSQNYPQIKDNLLEFKHEFPKTGSIYSLYPKKQAGILRREEIIDSYINNDIEKTFIKDSKQHIASHLIPESKYLNGFNSDTYLPQKKFKNEPEFIFFGTISMKPGKNYLFYFPYFSIKLNHI